jgi:N-acyl-L-homoserine lactone synthetase
MTNNNLIFREAQNAAELRSLIQLRYKVYRGCKLASLSPEHPSGLELDCYDLRSRHYGLFAKEGSCQTPVAYVRLIQDSIAPHAEQVLEIAAPFSDITEKLLQEPSTPLYLLTHYSELSEATVCFYSASKTRGEMLCEASRFTIDSTYRLPGMARIMIESVIAVFIQSSFSHAMISCSLTHARFYFKYGFKLIEELPLFYNYGNSNIVLICSHENIPSPFYERTIAMSKVLRQTGCICHYPEHPGCYFPTPQFLNQLPSKITLAARKHAS